MFDYLTFNNMVRLLTVVLDISLIWIIIYYGLKLIKNNSRTIQIFKGIIFIILVRIAAGFFGLSTLEWLANLFISWGPLAIIIIFQPEIRSILERMGKTSLFSRISTLTINEKERLVDELVASCIYLSETKTGALISLEQGISLSDFIKTGTPMNSLVSNELIATIFAYGTPLHDGAIIIQGDKIACASAYFPPTNKELPSKVGSRHRAAMGISEITDCITLVISEETGSISISNNGILRHVTIDELRTFLLMSICHTNVTVDKNTFKTIEAVNDQELIDEDIDREEVKTKKTITASTTSSKIKAKRISYDGEEKTTDSYGDKEGEE